MLTNGRLIVNHDLHALCFPSMTRKNPAAVALGRMTSAKKAAAARRNAKLSVAARMRLTQEERTAIAKNAAAARWRKKR
jgi:hypothetical protein